MTHSDYQAEFDEASPLLIEKATPQAVARAIEEHPDLTLCITSNGDYDLGHNVAISGPFYPEGGRASDAYYECVCTPSEGQWTTFQAKFKS